MAEWVQTETIDGPLASIDKPRVCTSTFLQTQFSRGGDLPKLIFLQVNYDNAHSVSDVLRFVVHNVQDGW